MAGTTEIIGQRSKEKGKGRERECVCERERVGNQRVRHDTETSNFHSIKSD